MTNDQRIREISEFLQARLRAEGMDEAGAVCAAKWLDEASLLSDRKSGLPLRNILRRLQKAGQLEQIAGASQESNQKYGRWWIRRV